MRVAVGSAGTRDFERDWQPTFVETKDYEHGRQEVRRCYAIRDVGWLQERCKTPWNGLRSVALVESTGTTRDRSTGKAKTSMERRDLIRSLPGEAGKTLHANRSQWGIENTLH